MNKISRNVFIGILLTLVSITVFSSCKKQYQTGAIDDEADKAAEVFWAKSFSKCGDSYFGKTAPPEYWARTAPMIYEFKEPYFFTHHEMDDRVFTEADKLNGLEWVGRTSMMISKAHRFYSNGEWSEWEDSTPYDQYKKMHASVRKIKGKWDFKLDVAEGFIAVPCEEVPK